MRVMLILILAVSGVACATSTPQANTQSERERAEEIQRAQEGMKYMEQGWAEQRTCYTAWAVLLNEWHANGGGIKSSIVATREQIATDKKSSFARIVRDVWASQKSVRADHSLPVGSWPISSDESRRVFKDATPAIKVIQPEDCQTFSELDDLLWEEVVERKGEKVTVRRLRETPVSMEWLGHDASMWISYWIFVRLD